MMFALRSSPDHMPIKSKGPIKKTSHLRPIYLYGHGSPESSMHTTAFPISSTMHPLRVSLCKGLRLTVGISLMGLDLCFWGIKPSLISIHTLGYSEFSLFFGVVLIKNVYTGPKLYESTHVSP